MTRRPAPIDEPAILSEGFACAYGPRAPRTLARTLNAQEAGEGRDVLVQAFARLERKVLDLIARCADPLRRFMRRRLGRTPDCTACPAGLTCPRASRH